MEYMNNSRCNLQLMVVLKVSFTSFKRAPYSVYITAITKRNLEFNECSGWNKGSHALFLYKAYGSKFFSFTSAGRKLSCVVRRDQINFVWTRQETTKRSMQGRRRDAIFNCFALIENADLIKNQVGFKIYYYYYYY